jgi:hypothetical protein
VGASGWQTSVPWQPDLALALAAARANEYARMPALNRKRVENTSAAQLIEAADIGITEDDESWEAWLRWVDRAPPETRYVLAFGPNGTILDIDHVGPGLQSLAEHPPLGSPGELRIVAPEPGVVLGAVRWATREELIERYDTERPTTIDGDDWWDSLERGDAIAVVRWDGDRPVEIVFFGVSGD